MRSLLGEFIQMNNFSIRDTVLWKSTVWPFSGFILLFLKCSGRMKNFKAEIIITFCSSVCVCMCKLREGQRKGGWEDRAPECEILEYF